MFCAWCGKQLPDAAGFCSECGAQVGRGGAPVADAATHSRAYVQEVSVAASTGAAAGAVSLSPSTGAQAPGMAVAGFICGLVGLVLSLLPVITLASPPLGMVGFILSLVGRGQAKSRNAPTALATAGAILSFLVLLWSIYMLVKFAQAYDALTS